MMTSEDTEGWRNNARMENSMCKDPSGIERWPIREDQCA